MELISIKETIKHFEKLQKKTDLVRGSQKMGLASHWWDGRTQGINDCVEYLKTKQED
ncbi:MAG: hypothetical protein PHS93_09000 [Candidatus Omnitrophica bacterium]|nr:hypothetical protein [Candidatus Omnitrophota bacterium]MDD5353282.1 hypothetical protein [Candidatus Omnitrophota bacterium]